MNDPLLGALRLEMRPISTYLLFYYLLNHIIKKKSNKKKINNNNNLSPISVRLRVRLPICSLLLKSGR